MKQKLENFSVSYIETIAAGAIAMSSGRSPP